MDTIRAMMDKRRNVELRSSVICTACPTDQEAKKMLMGSVFDNPYIADTEMYYNDIGRICTYVEGNEVKNQSIHNTLMGIIAAKNTNKAILLAERFKSCNDTAYSVYRMQLSANMGGGGNR